MLFYGNNYLLIFPSTYTINNTGAIMNIDYTGFYAQLEVCFILLLFGFIMGKAKVLGDLAINGMNHILSKVFIPTLIITMITGSVTRSELFASFDYFIASLCIYMLLLIISKCSSKLFKFEHPSNKIFTGLMTLGNSGLLGVPLAIALFTPENMLATSIFIVADQIIIWTVGMYLFNTEKKFQIKGNLKSKLNMITGTLILSLMLVLLDIKLPTVLNTAIKSLSNCGLPVVMVCLGVQLSKISAKQIFSYTPIYYIIGFKMIVIPVVIYTIISYIGIFNYTENLNLALMVSLPSIAMIGPIAKTNGSDYEFGTSGTLLTTIASCLSIPFVFWLIHLADVYLLKI